MDNLKNLDSLTAQARKVIEPYLKELLKIHQDNIVSIFLCGQAAGADYRPGISNINLFLVLNNLGFPQLQRSLKIVSAGIGKKITAPLFLTRKHIQTSTDVFPIEFLEMKESNLLLYGEDLLAGIEVNPAHIRLFCEQQIKGKLIRIRQAYLEIGLKRKGIEGLLKESLASLAPIFRNLIRLKGKTPPVKKELVFKQLAEEFNLEKEVFLAILNDNKNDEKIAAEDIEVFFARYIAQIQKLAIAVDQL